MSVTSKKPKLCIVDWYQIKLLFTQINCFLREITIKRKSF